MLVIESALFVLGLILLAVGYRTNDRNPCDRPFGCDSHDSPAERQKRTRAGWRILEVPTLGPPATAGNRLIVSFAVFPMTADPAEIAARLRAAMPGIRGLSKPSP